MFAVELAASGASSTKLTSCGEGARLPFKARNVWLPKLPYLTLAVGFRVCQVQ